MPVYRKKLHTSLDSPQQIYKLTDKEFLKTPKEKVIQAYRNFAKLAGEDSDSYPRKN